MTRRSTTAIWAGTNGTVPQAPAREPELTLVSSGDSTLTKDLKHFVYAHRGFQYALPVGDVLEIVQVAALLPFHGAMS